MTVLLTSDTHDPVMMIRSALAVLFVAVLSPSVFCQIAFGGRPIGPLREWPVPVVVDFPAVDAQRLLIEDAVNARSGAKGPLRFGMNHPTDLTMENSGTWTTDGAGTAIWRLGIHCPDARSINFVFGGFFVPEGARVFVQNAAGDLLGAFTQASSGGRTSLGVSPLPGDRITIQYEEPVGMSGTGSLRITQVTHGYRGAGEARGLGDSDPCNNNVICPEGDPLRDQIASVAMVIANGNGWCTGQLINNCDNDGTPYFLTANHCVNGQNPANWTFRFSWESPTCDPTSDGPTGHTVSGATLLVNSPASDVALLRLNTTPPPSYGIQYTGWDASGEFPSSSTVIHHPSGDVKKISFNHDAPVTSEFDGAGCWHILAWDDGTTEGGSSGSGLWDQNGRLIGQLFGGEADCDNNVNDHFGRFDLSYPLLTPWLGTCGPPVLDGYDPNAAPPTLDASLLTITGIGTNYCNASTISPVIAIRNNGSSPLTQLSIAYDVDGDGSTTFTWNGDLATGEAASIPLPDMTVTSGAHVFHVTCDSPNGGTDEDPANDLLAKTFHVADPGEAITLTIHTDDYGSETTWFLDVDGTTFFNGGPYADVSGGTTETAQFCLEEACFSFRIMDAYGDGICCSVGNGDYVITDGDGDVILDGNGAFGSQATTPFCTGQASIPEPAQAAPLVFPDPSTGIFTIQLAQPESPIGVTVFDALGRPVARERLRTVPCMLDLSSLPVGHYVLRMDTEKMHAVRRVTLAR